MKITKIENKGLHMSAVYGIKKINVIIYRAFIANQKIWQISKTDINDHFLDNYEGFEKLHEAKNWLLNRIKNSMFKI